VLRLSKETDYALVLLSSYVDAWGRGAIESARDVADRTGLPRPVVGKVLKGLARADLLESHRGVNGGYALARRPSEVSVVDVIEAIEGPIAVTECGAPDLVGLCTHESRCSIRGPVGRLTRVVRDTLARVTLADLADGDATALATADHSAPAPTS